MLREGEVESAKDSNKAKLASKCRLEACAPQKATQTLFQMKGCSGPSFKCYFFLTSTVQFVFFIM